MADSDGAGPDDDEYDKLDYIPSVSVRISSHFRQFTRMWPDPKYSYFTEKEKQSLLIKRFESAATAFFCIQEFEVWNGGSQDNFPILESGVNVGNAVESRQSPSVSRQISLLLARCICQYMLSGIIIFIVQGSCPSLNKSEFFLFFHKKTFLWTLNITEKVSLRID